MVKALDLIGQKIGMFTVMERVPPPINAKIKISFWKCLCDCGKECIIPGQNLKSGNSYSCGCYQRNTSKDLYFNSDPEKVRKQSMKLIDY